MQFIRKSLGAQALMAAVVVIGLYFGYSFAREVVHAEMLSRQAENGAKINAQIAEENRKLERDLQYYGSDEYAELRARTDLNMRNADELVILPVMPKEEQPGAQLAEAAPAEAEPDAPEAGPPVEATAEVAPARNWDRWLSLFTTGLR